jgi:hypothetical protein
MKRNFSTLLLASVFTLSAPSLFAGSPGFTATSTTENFNSRNGIRLSQVKGYLQGNCWFFSDFDVNRSGWIPQLEGDGAMVSGLGASPTEMTGIFTPVLDMQTGNTLTFIYKFNEPVHDRRWIKVYATDGNDKPVFLLDSLELTGSANGSIYKYSKVLSLPKAGQYKLYINYQGVGGAERIAIDQLSIDAPAHYQGACNVAPVALRDKFTGTASHTASGNVLSNDYDPNHETMTAYLLTDSEDGVVDMKKDGSFDFLPRDGFTGSATKFSYKVCDDGQPSLCSITTTATIRFPSRSSLVNFQAMSQKNAVDISWNAGADNKASLFEVQRSLDGSSFESVGVVKAEEAGRYAFTDKVRETTAKRNDLYYRLRQVDAAGRITYSKVLIVRTYGTKSVAAISVTPDPGVNDIQVNVQLKEKSVVVMHVRDNSGAEVIKKTALGENGANMYNIEGTNQLQPGMYQLEVIINSNERLTMQLAKS